MSLVNCGLPIAHILGWGIQVLSLKGNRLVTFNDRTLILPLGLKSLDLSDSSIASITVDLPPRLVKLDLSNNQLSQIPAKLPSRLKILDLSGNGISDSTSEHPQKSEVLKMNNCGLTSVPTLPASLKILECSGNDLGSEDSSISDSVFPGGLKKLDLSNNGIGDNEIRTMNLTKCIHLRSLNLSHNELDELDLELLPTSLVELDLSSNPTTSYKGDSKTLKYFKAVYLRKNTLEGFFGEARKKRELSFGPNIRTVDVTHTPLTEYDVRALSKELAHKPKFERFDIEEEFRQPLIDPISTETKED